MSARAQRVAVSAERRGMLAKVHLARKQLGLDEDGYRAVVRRATGGDSAAAASDAALHRLLAEFGRLGFKPARPPISRVRSPEGNKRLIVALWGELAPFLRDSSAEVLRGFVGRQTRSRLHPDGVSAPEFLDGAQANKVIEGLKAWLARERKRAGLEGAP